MGKHKSLQNSGKDLSMVICMGLQGSGVTVRMLPELDSPGINPHSSSS